MLETVDTKLVLGVSAATLATLLVILKASQKKYNLPPGPTPLPVVGNLLALSKLDYPYLHFVELGKKYGDMFTLYLGTNRLVILNSMETIREAFLKKNVDFADRPKTLSGDLLGGSHSVMFAHYTPEWKIQRKIVNSALRKFVAADSLEPLLQDSAENVLKLIDEEDGKPFDPFQKMTFLIYNIIGSMVVGKGFDVQDPFFKTFTSDIDAANDQLGNGLVADFFPILRCLPSNGAKLWGKVMEQADSFLSDAWEEHVKNFNPDEVTDFVYHVIAAKKEAEKEDGIEAVGKLTQKHYHNLLMDLFLAGTDPPRFLLTWLIGFCTVDQEVQRRIHQEIDEVVGRDQPVGRHHRQLLPYTEAAVLEALRMYPVAPLAVPRTTTCDTEVGGYTMPKGTWIIPNIWAVHRDPKVWEDPDAFKPERHLTAEGTLKPKTNSFMPFSVGRRMCVGESLAKVELPLLAATLFQRYTFLPPPGVDIKMESIRGIFCLPQPFKVIAKVRQ